MTCFCRLFLKFLEKKLNLPFGPSPHLKDPMFLIHSSKFFEMFKGVLSTRLGVLARMKKDLLLETWLRVFSSLSDLGEGLKCFWLWTVTALSHTCSCNNLLCIEKCLA